LRTAIAKGEAKMTAAEQAAASIWLRPERSAVGRPAQWSRAEITQVALRIADAEGLDAVSMRRVAAELGTGAASLYRYVQTREDLLDLMSDATGAEYEPAPPTGDWLADLIAFGEQARFTFRRHRWLAGLTMTRPVIGPNGIALIEHFLTLLQEHPAGIEAKMEAFGMLNGITAAFALHEQADHGLQARNLAYLGHALTSGKHPRLAAFLSPQAQLPHPEELAGRYPDLIARVLTGLLGPA
jgi:AcrR family transcriptional regulator